MIGYGDEIIASGLAKGAAARGKRIAFGNGQQIDWHPFAHIIFQGNPNVAPPGNETAKDIEWVAHYRGNRIYGRDNKTTRKWEWIPHQIKQPGEVFLTEAEMREARSKVPSDFILIEPNVPAFKMVRPNKQWPIDRYQSIVDELVREGQQFVQLTYSPPFGPGAVLQNVKPIPSNNFRISLAILRLSKLYLGPEGGMHHGAAAVGTPAVVIFGGFISPDVTGYAFHKNHFCGGNPCGSYEPCDHCVAAMMSIKTEDVLASCRELLAKGKDDDVSKSNAGPSEQGSPVSCIACG